MVHNVTYADSIEQNKLSLILAKKRMSDVLKHKGVMRDVELFQSYGLTENFLDQCIQKVREQTEEGTRTKLSFGRWGQQTIE